VVPQHLHVADFVLNGFNLLVAVINKVGVSKLFGGVTKVANLDVKVVDFSVYCLKLSESILASALVLVEIALLEILSVNLKILFQLSDLVVILLSLALNKG
jgi:hypothetical protein